MPFSRPVTLGDCMRGEVRLAGNCTQCGELFELDCKDLHRQFSENQIVSQAALAPRLTCPACQEPNPTLIILSMGNL